MRVTKGAKLFAGTALLALAVAACGGGGDSGSPGATSSGGGDTPVRMEIGEPQKLFYPSDTTETEGAEVLAAIFAPLVSYNDQKETVNEVAQSIESTDNTVWTIKLKPNYTWHNGEKLIAQNYIDAWNFAANQENVQSASYFFGRIKGYADLNPGEGKTPSTKEMSGLKAVDDTTLEVTLEKPFSQFPVMLGYTAFYPLPKAAFGTDGKVTEDYAKKPIGQGQFSIDKPYGKGTDQAINLTRYDAYPGAKPKFSKLQFKVYTSTETAYNDLRGGQLDIVDQLAASSISTAKTDLGERYIEQPDAGIGYVGFPLKYNKDYENVKVREAISMAIDRQTIADKVFSGTRAPADDFINPAISGYKQGACAVCVYDPAKAKETYAAANGPKKLELGYNADGGHKEWIEAVANNLRASLGVEVAVKPFEKFQAILDELDAKKYTGMFRMGWAIDYPSPENYLTPIFSTEAAKTGSNYAGYSNKEFDELLVKGDTADTPEAGLEFYRQAADVLNKDLPYIPVYFYKINAGYSEHVKGVKINLLNQVEWESVEKA
ncbi:ABC transporter substrate-binding protein [Spongiactinospora sp. TRM90649]|uniref:peptide ABC transporter substrate-binding protein n=1 Tax=Spongiactinospora sp. TRM90649 TaxID=3031114 RepID=UPI0023F70497|nr:ABC transporter substrate-binding protein [Spongiactinospora sp. TRM90649]MDF5757846.1 ABC transporter substrate-binding protein [Spongiactinospora sp. TRM90649]